MHRFRVAELLCSKYALDPGLTGLFRLSPAPPFERSSNRAGCRALCSSVSSVSAAGAETEMRRELRTSDRSLITALKTFAMLTIQWTGWTWRNTKYDPFYNTGPKGAFLRELESGRRIRSSDRLCGVSHNLRRVLGKTKNRSLCARL